ncbi:MAG: chorismate synthase [Treponema sp.]
MSGNTFGTLFTVTTFGESHGAAIGTVIDGCPPGIPLSAEDFAADMAVRRPIGPFETTRREDDLPEILSGVFEGKTLGTPIAVLIRNTGSRPHDYEALQHIYRPGHADFAYEAKYRRRDWRGGGRASGRETAARVAAGTVAKKILSFCTAGLHTGSSPQSPAAPLTIEVRAIEIAGIVCAPLSIHSELPEPIRERLNSLKQAGDSAGAVLRCTVKNVPAGLGEPVFDKLDAELAKAMLSIGAVKAVSFGSGFDLARMTGSQANAINENHHGGVAGGISDGRDIIFDIAVKPVPSIALPQTVLNDKGTTLCCSIPGRHDTCLYRRIMPVVEAMTAIVLADMLLRTRGGDME